MAEYIRFVSYVFTYHGNERGRNVGYVKFESRFGIKRIMAQLTNMRQVSCWSVYLMYKEQDTFVGISIGSILSRNQRGEFSYSTSQELFGNNECTLQELCGILFLPEEQENYYLLSLWEDEVFSLDHFVPSREDLVTIPQEEVSLERPSELEERTDTEQTKAPEQNATVKEEYDMLSAPLQERRPAGTHHWAPVANHWNHLCKLYPKVCPFPYETEICCLRVKPGDIGRLPREYWHLASNSFLLHAYYQNRYLLFFRKGTGENALAFLGIPGYYTENERFMAEMFGFVDFKPSPNQTLSEGSFGYWLVELNL